MLQIQSLKTLAISDINHALLFSLIRQVDNSCEQWTVEEASKDKITVCISQQQIAIGVSHENDYEEWWTSLKNLEIGRPYVMVSSKDWNFGRKQKVKTWGI